MAEPTDYADLEKRLRERTVAVRGPAGVFTTVLCHEPDALCAEAASAISALVRERELRAAGEFLFSKRKALVERCAALVDMLESQVNPLRSDAGVAKQALKEAAAFIRANGLSSPGDAEDSCMNATEAASAISALVRERDARAIGIEGHGAECFACHEPCDGLTGNSSQWPVALANWEQPGKIAWWHCGCATAAAQKGLSREDGVKE